jgi:hypothetical protein
VHVSPLLPTDGLPWNLLLGICIKICQGNPYLIKLREKYQELYLKMYIHFIVAGNIKAP